MAVQRKGTWSSEEVRALGLHTTVELASDIFGISRSHGYELIRRGEFPVEVLKIGKRLRVPIRPILELLHAEQDGAA